MVRENHRRQRQQRQRTRSNDHRNAMKPTTANTSTMNTTNSPTICAIPFGRNYFYPLATLPQPLNHTLSKTSTNQTSTDDDNDSSDNDEPDTRCTSTYAQLPWNQNSSQQQQLSEKLPLSATCSSQSTIIVSPTDGKVYQSGTMHGTVYTNWKHIVIPLPLKCVQVSAGRHYCLARMEGGNAVMSWGAGHFGQLGVVVSTKTTTTTKTSKKSDHYDEDDSSSDDDDDDSSNGRSGRGTRKAPTIKCISFTTQPVLIERLLPSVTGSPIQSIAAGDWHALALTESGHVWSWGSNRSLQCGIPLSKGAASAAASSSMGSLALPLPIPGLPPMKQIAAGRAHSCALTAGSGKVYCWGSSHTGQCGTGNTLRRSIKGLLPTPVQGLPSSLEMIHIDAAGNHCISLSTAGRVFTWGDGREGQLGFSISTSTSKCISLQDLFSNKPRLVADLDFVAVAASRALHTEHRHKISTDGGHVVSASTDAETKSSTPVSSAAQLLARTPKITSVYASDNGSAAISSSGHVYCWGSNDVGQLGLPIPNNIPHEDTTDSSLPDQTVNLQQQPYSNENNHQVPTRPLHMQTFDSNHNLLLPIRVGDIDGCFIRSLVMGPNHMVCFGTERTTEEQAMIVGQTLYEAQERQSCSGHPSDDDVQIIGVSYKADTPGIIHRPIATGIYVSSTKVDDDGCHNRNSTFIKEPITSGDKGENGMNVDINNLSKVNDVNKNSTSSNVSNAHSTSRTTSSSSSPNTTTQPNALRDQVDTKPLETFGPSTVHDYTINTVNATHTANATNLTSKSGAASSPTKLQHHQQSMNENAVISEPIEKRDYAVRRRFSFTGLFTRRASSSRLLPRPRRGGKSHAAHATNNCNDQNEPSTGTVTRSSEYGNSVDNFQSDSVLQLQPRWISSLYVIRQSSSPKRHEEDGAVETVNNNGCNQQMVDVNSSMSLTDWMSSLMQLPWTPYYNQVPVVAVTTNSESSLTSYWAFVLTIGFTVFVYVVEGYLDYRQLQSYRKTIFPDALTQTVTAIDNDVRAIMEKNKTKTGETKSKDETDENTAEALEKSLLLPQLQDKFRKAQAYGLDKIQFGMFAAMYDVMESVAFLLLGFAPAIWDYSVQKGQDWFQWNEEHNEIYISLLFLGFITLIGTVTSLPFELYSTFQIERKHGFNKQTFGLFCMDKIKGLFLTAIIGAPFSSLLLYIIKTGGKYFYLYVWGFLFVFSIIMMTLVPVVIMPMFNKYEPLPEGTLKARIYALADRLKYPLTKLFVMDGSKRSSHSNAFMFGFGKNKRIVLFDTLLTQVKEDEILAILGHELGHWKLGHTLSSFVTTQVYTGVAFYFFALTYGSTDLYSAFGFNDPNRPTATLIALMLFFQTLWAPVDKILSFILTIVSRQNEFGADKFSVELGMSRDLQSGLCKIHIENLGAMNPDPYYSAYHYSHPPLVERLQAMMTLDQKRK